MVRAAHKHRVKRVVITSSVAAIMAELPGSNKGEKGFTEDDWSDISTCGPYEKSKTLAEKAAWDFMYGLPEEERFELVTINPGLILGPSLIASDFTSGQIIKKLMSGKYPGMPKIMLPVVDVRDAAFAHLQAIKVDRARNKRFALVAESMWFKDLA